MKFSSVFRFSFTFIFTHNLIVFSKCKSLNESTKRKTIFNISIVEDYMIINMQVILPVEDEDKLDLIILVLIILIEIMIMIIVLINLIWLILIISILHGEFSGERSSERVITNLLMLIILILYIIYIYIDTIANL